MSECEYIICRWLHEYYDMWIIVNDIEYEWYVDKYEWYMSEWVWVIYEWVIDWVLSEWMSEWVIEWDRDCYVIDCD